MADDTTADSLANAILSKLRGARSRSDDDDLDLEGEVGGRRGYVRIERLRREIDKRRAAEDLLEELGGKVEQLGSAYETQLGDLKAQTAQEVTRITTQHQEDLRLVDLGVTDPLGRSIVREAWGALPKTGRPASAGDWYEQLRQAHAAHAEDPKTHEAPSVPRPLQPYLTAPEASAAESRLPPTPTGPRPGQTGLEGLDPSQGIDALMTALRGMDIGG